APDGQHETLRGALARELVRVPLDLLLGAAQLEHLPQEEPGEVKIGRVAADLRLAARIAGDADAIADAVALVELRVEPDLRAAPCAQARIEREIRRLLGAPMRIEAVLPHGRRAEGRMPLRDVGRGEIPGDV